jgi:arylsulfatase A-like enzyme/plastocyanin
MAGKYLNGYGYDQSTYVPPGWDRWVAFVNIDGQGSYYNYDLTVDGAVVHHGSSEADYSTDVLAAEATNFIATTDPAQPLFLYFAPKAPHGGAIPAPRHAGAFDDLGPLRPPNFNEPDVSDKPAWVQSIPPLSDTLIAHIDESAKGQYGTLLAVDDAIGAIVQALADSGRLSNTMIVFTSDNGHAWGEHRWWEKRVPYEESIRVPMVIRYDPLTSSSWTDDRLVLNIDLAPTFASLAGISGQPADGSDLLTLLSGQPPGTWRQDFLVENYGPETLLPSYCAVRTEHSIYVRYGTAEEEFYDLDGDPYELQNAASDPARAAVLATQRARIRELCSPPPPAFALPPAPVTIDSGPSSLTTETEATFAFSSDESGTTFQCTLDGASAPCSSPITYTGLGPGVHAFSVQVHDVVGGVGGTASWTWTVQAVGATVTVKDFAFAPRTTSDPLGGDVVWTFTGPSDHTVTDSSGMGLFSSGPASAGSTYQFTFFAAGSYRYACSIHPAMGGALQVSPVVAPAGGNLATEFMVTWAAWGAPAGYVYDVQIKRPGATWRTWRGGQTGPMASFVADSGPGTYAFRARIRNTLVAKASLWSLVRSIEVTP